MRKGGLYPTVANAANEVAVQMFLEEKIKFLDIGDIVEKALADFTTGSAMIEDGQLSFYAYSDKDIKLINGSLFTIDFIIPENAGQGEVYPIGISYVDDGIACDTFINSARDEAGKLQMTYVFTKGIYNGYLKIMGEKKTTAATTVTTAATAETITVPVPLHLRGDADGDGSVSVNDAQLTLKAYTNRIAGNDMELTDEQLKSADADENGTVSVEDAQLILRYYTEKTVAGRAVTWDDLLSAG